MKYTTDILRVEEFFRNSKGRLVDLKEITVGMDITEYSGRISNVRTKWSCTCGQNKLTCEAVEHIKNIRKCKYRYVNKKLFYGTINRTVEASMSPFELLPARTEPLTGEALKRWQQLGLELKRRLHA